MRSHGQHGHTQRVQHDPAARIMSRWGVLCSVHLSFPVVLVPDETIGKIIPSFPCQRKSVNVSFQAGNRRLHVIPRERADRVCAPCCRPIEGTGLRGIDFRFLLLKRQAFVAGTILLFQTPESDGQKSEVWLPATLLRPDRGDAGACAPDRAVLYCDEPGISRQTAMVRR